MTAEETQLLTSALTRVDAENGLPRVVGILSLEAQVVAGTNYRFHVSGCAAVSAVTSAGKCSSSTETSCRAKN
jgi:uncharacterized ParB-like nuclease family protein